MKFSSRRLTLQISLVMKNKIVLCFPKASCPPSSPLTENIVQLLQIKESLWEIYNVLSRWGVTIMKVLVMENKNVPFPRREFPPSSQTANDV